MLDFLTRRVPGRAVRLAAQAAVLAAVVGGTVAYAHQTVDVTLVLDGSGSTVAADADDVAGLLADRDIRVGPHDLVEPAPGVTLRAGQRVVVRFARPLTVTVDGAVHTYWTRELTVAAALDALGIRADGARLSPSRAQPLGRQGLDVVLSHPKRVTLVADGRAREVTTAAATVADLLREQHVATRPADRLSVLPESPVVDGLVVALTRIERRRVVVVEIVTPSTVQRPAAGLPKGRRRILSAGRPGTQRTVYEIVLADGRPTSRIPVSAVLVRPAVPRVVTVGTGRPPDGGAHKPVPGADGLNWGALARCESGGNPRAVNPAGYYGLFQFSPGTWRSVGGSGLPSRASSDEQLYRAKLLFRRGGARQWGCGHHLYDR